MSKPKEMAKRILALLGKEGGRPLTKSEIARTLEVPGSLRKELREQITALEEAGKIFKGKKARYELGGKKSGEQKSAKTERSGRASKGASGELVGKLKVNAGGHGWFYVNKGPFLRVTSGDGNSVGWGHCPSSRGEE